ncbi:MAG: MFS transporter [Reyranellaceae bacterium]
MTTDTAAASAFPPVTLRQRLLIFAVLLLAFTLCQFLRSSLAVVAPEMVQELGLTPRELGFITAIFFVAMAAMQIPAGMMFDRFGVRPITGTALVAAVAGGVIFSTGHELWQFLLGQFLFGIGMSPLFMGSIMVVARWWGAAKFATLSATMMAISYVGNIGATMPLAHAIEWVGWRYSMLGPSIILGVATALFFLVVRDAPPGHPWWGERRKESAREVFAGVLEALRHPVMPGLLAASFIGYAAGYAIRGLWIGPYMLDVFGLDAITRGDILFVSAIMGMVGLYVSGQLAGRFNPRPVVMGFAGVAGVSLALLALVGDPGMTLFLIAFLAFSMVANFFPAVMGHAQMTFPERLRGRSLTLINFSCFVGVGITQVVTGYLIDSFPSDARGAHPEEAYRAMYAYLACLLAAGIAVYAVFGKVSRRS